MFKSVTYKVLLVDTNLKNAQACYQLLRKIDLSTDIALSMKAALNLLMKRQKNYGCIIIHAEEWQMHQGIKLLSRIKRTLGIHRIPVILLCPEATSDLIKKALHLGVFECVTDPWGTELTQVLHLSFYYNTS